MESMTYPSHIRNIEPDEKCNFCDKKHVAWLKVITQSRYTSVYNLPYCEDHKEKAEEVKSKAASYKLSENCGAAWD